MKCKLDNAFRCFLVNFMKNGYQLEKRISLVATWNCHIHSYNRNSHLHNYNRDSHARNALQKMILAWLQRTPTCIIPIKLVTHIFAAKTLTCINAAETSNTIALKFWDEFNVNSVLLYFPSYRSIKIWHLYFKNVEKKAIRPVDQDTKTFPILRNILPW